MEYQKVCVGGLLKVNNKVLIVRRSPKETSFVGHYELPGGKVDFGEHPEQSLEKEFLEEVNLKVKALHPFTIFTYTLGERHTIELVYLVELKDDINNIKLSEEHDNYQFISLEELDSVKMTEQMKENIKKGLI